MSQRSLQQMEIRPNRDLPEAKSLHELIQPPVEDLLIRRFFQDDAESYFVFIDMLDGVKSLAEAEAMIDEEARQQGVQHDLLAVTKLKLVIRRKFGQ